LLTNINSWPKIDSHLDATGVRYGHISVSEKPFLSVCFL
jgi:hypothetical protein